MCSIRLSVQWLKELRKYVNHYQPMREAAERHVRFTLWWFNMTMDNHHFYRKTHYKWPFSIAMSVTTRGYLSCWFRSSMLASERHGRSERSSAQPAPASLMGFDHDHGLMIFDDHRGICSTQYPLVIEHSYRKWPFILNLHWFSH